MIRAGIGVPHPRRVVGRFRRVVVARRCTQHHLRRVMVETPSGRSVSPTDRPDFFVPRVERFCAVRRPSTHRSGPTFVPNRDEPRHPLGEQGSSGGRLRRRGLPSTEGLTTREPARHPAPTAGQVLRTQGGRPSRPRAGAQAHRRHHGRQPALGEGRGLDHRDGTPGLLPRRSRSSSAGAARRTSRS